MGGGHGHVCRSLHIVRAIRALAPTVEVKLLGPERCRAIVPTGVGYEAPPSRTREVLGRWFATLVEDFQPRVVVVDTFPRGVMGELRFRSGQKRVLVTRLVPPAYYQKAQVRDACYAFDQIYWSEGKTLPEYPGIEVEPVTDTRPILSARKSSHRTLGLGTGIYQHGDRLRNAFEAAFGSEGQWIDQGSWRRDLGLQFPSFELLVSASGYNTFYEALRAGLPTIFIPQERKYDFQDQRVQAHLETEPDAPFRIAGSAPSADSLLHLAGELNGRRATPRNFRGAEQIACDLLGKKFVA